MKKATVAVILVLVAGAGAWAWRHFRQGEARRWRTGQVSRGEIRVTVSANGVCRPIGTVQVGCQVSGRVKEVLADNDEFVKAGQVLARIDPALLDAEVKQREASRTQARAALSIAESKVDYVRAQAGVAECQVQRQLSMIERAQATLGLAEKNVARFREMVRMDASAQSLLDEKVLELAVARTGLAIAKTDEEQAKRELVLLSADLKQAQASVDHAKAELAQADAALDRAKVDLLYATIISPVDGVVLKREVEPGQTIAAAFQTPILFTLAQDLNRMRIEAEVDESDIGNIVTGQRATFEVDAHRGRVFEGTVLQRHVQPVSKGGVVNYVVLVAVKDPDGRLLPGMTARLTFHVEVRAGRLRVPNAALRFVPPADAAPKDEGEPGPAGPDGGAGRQGHHARVYTATESGRLRSHWCRVGDGDARCTELLEGDLREGQALVVGQVEPGEDGGPEGDAEAP